jgi:predicted PurR-regulated permease PerM
MWAVGIPYALVLGILAFIFESVPNIGPIAAAAPALVLAYINAPWKAVYVLVFTLVLHQLSNQFLVPKVMGKILNISAFVIILGLIIGGELAGITGMILALPVVAALQVMAQEWPNIKTRIPKNEKISLRD